MVQKIRQEDCCEVCQHFEPAAKPEPDAQETDEQKPGDCRRYPLAQSKLPDGYCGEFIHTKMHPQPMGRFKG